MNSQLKAEIRHLTIAQMSNRTVVTTNHRRPPSPKPHKETNTSFLKSLLGKNGKLSYERGTQERDLTIVVMVMGRDPSPNHKISVDHIAKLSW